MPQYTISFAGRENEAKVVDLEDVEMARNEAVRYLGIYLSEHPGFANEGHWRVNVDDSGGRSLLHVIVATVLTRPSKFSAPPERALYAEPIPNV